MFSIAPGSWFLSPLFVLGSSDPFSDHILIRFQRSQFQNLRIRVLNAAEEILFSSTLHEDLKELEISMASWPKGIYRLFLEDEEKTYQYQVLHS